MLLLGECFTMVRPPRAGGVLIRGERISAVGDADELRARYPGEKRLTVERITPGVHDAHVHPLLWGAALEEVDLAGLGDEDRIAARVAARAATRTPGEWIRGGGYLLDHHPRSELLDQAAPLNPTLLASRDLHSAWANREALRRARIDASTADPEGGVIVRDAQGRPTGALLERAVELVTRVAPRLSRDDLERGLADLARRGHVAAHAMPFGMGDDLEWAEALAVSEQLPLRLWWALPRQRWRSVSPGWRGENLEVAAVKLFADGALGSRTAWMHEPYPDGSRGMPLDPPELLRSEGEAALAAGYTVAVHAIGTRAVEEVATLFRGLAPRARRPLRLEHVQHVRDEELVRLRGLPAALSIQPAHLIEDAELVRRLLPGREGEAFRFRDLAASDLPLAFGSDAPVIRPEPETSLSSAIAQSLEQAAALTEEEALRAMTLGGAQAAGWDDCGRLVADARADLALWEAGRLVGRVWRGRPEWIGSS